ncbi:hypothetical protein FYK55_26135 [Roseiconus nitratireducens]|uniref:Peptidase M50B-like protein n=1 Tax=Roseiconus nitratireducens TaxID=2605748 RepID=A0A5M6CUI6_9BACT|nr:hypothetical protein [Roseiconus nitratireducens]KAA5538918.1 hypothetical protein FYK55_26135 [Roseiconus nitratireducens]
MNHRGVQFAALMLVAWCVMAITHEVGHLIGGWLGGARLQAFDLAPWRLPYSVHQPDPYPLLTLWSGPLLGVAIPWLACWLIRRDWCWLIADFCLIANGSYLALSWPSKDPLLDSRRMLDAGTHPIWIVCFCLGTIGLGYVRFRKDCVEFFLSDRDDRDSGVAGHSS